MAVNQHEDNRFYIGDFDDSLESMLIPLTEEIAKQQDFQDGRIDLYINSYGGYLHTCMHLVELVEIAKTSGITVRTIVPSIAASAGSMLAITGSPGERYIGRRAEHLIHYGSIVSFETTPKQVERFNAWKNRTFKGNLEHYKKYANVPNIDSEMLDDGWWITAKDSIKFGLADQYMEKLTP